jgi:hypothetical protein
MLQKLIYVFLPFPLALVLLAGQQPAYTVEIIIGEQQEETNIPWCGG